MHQPVLVGEVLELLGVRRGGTYVDGTVGSGGHAAAVMREAGGDAVLLGIDKDAEALARAGDALAEWGDRCRLVQGTFADVRSIASNMGVGPVDGVLFDLGLSSEQLGDAERGFSFALDGPLDMRMNQASPTTAADLLAGIDERDLALLLRRFGEERRAKSIAARIVERRARGRLTRTRELADAVGGGRTGSLHPATRTFQALRIAVNRELDDLQDGLVGALELLANGGRMAVISFHSLEDRIVKRFFQSHAGKNVSLPGGGEEWRGEFPRVSILTKKPVVASGEETRENRRARSAKLRAAERQPTPVHA